MKRIRDLTAGTLLAAPAVAQAADLPKEGSYDFTACWSGASNLISFSKTQRAFSYEVTGSTRSKPSDGMFDQHSFRCVGTNARFDNKPHAIAVCEAVDRDDDKRLTYFEQDADGKIARQSVAGTGKCEGDDRDEQRHRATRTFPDHQARHLAERQPANGHL